MKKIFKIISMAVIPLMISAIAGCGNPKELDFEYKAPKDTVLKYELELNSKQTATPQGEEDKKGSQEERTSAGSTKISFVEKTKEIAENGDRTVDHTFSNVVISRTVDGKTESTPVTQADGKTTNLKISKKGKIIERDGTEVEEEEGASQDLFVPAIFPEGKKKVGESWDSNVENEVPVNPQTKWKASVKTTFTFKGYEKFNNIDCARIDEQVTTSHKLIKDKAAEDQSPVDVDISAEGTATGHFLYDFKRGIVVKAERKADIKGITVIKDKKTKKEQKSTVVTENTMNLTLVSDKPEEIESSKPANNAGTDKTEKEEKAPATPEKQENK